MTFEKGDIIKLQPEEGFFPKRALAATVTDVVTSDRLEFALLIEPLIADPDIQPGLLLVLTPRVPNIASSPSMNVHLLRSRSEIRMLGDKNIYGWVTVDRAASKPEAY